MFDIFNRKKLQRAELEIEHLKRDIDSYEKEISTLKKKIRGDRVPGEHCSLCIHGVTVYGMPFTSYQCALDCGCKDFKRK